MLQGGNYYDHEKKHLTYTLVVGVVREASFGHCSLNCVFGDKLMARQDVEEEDIA